MDEQKNAHFLPRRDWYPVVVGLVIAVAAGLVAGCAPEFEDSTLDTYEVAVQPEVPAVLSVLQRPDEPFVMANFLVFKDMATGEGFEGLTGAEAYQIYSDGLAELQAALGSRLIWIGAVRSQVVGSADPVFETIALLEYASPSSFLTFAMSPGEAPEARTAGLLGQWLVASTTIEEPAPAEENVPQKRWARGRRLRDQHPAACDGGEITTPSGLSIDQICRLLAAPADEPVVMVEFLRFSDGSGELYGPYRETLAAVAAANRGELIWRGSFDTLVIGSASPSFDEMVVTRYPNPAAYLSVLRDPRVIAASYSRVDGLELHWIYAASSATEDLPF
jgi:hypothetical protein